MALEQIHRELGTISADIDIIKKQVSEMQIELREIRDQILQARGGWRVMATLAGLVGGMAGFLVSLIKLKSGA